MASDTLKVPLRKPWQRIDFLASYRSTPHTLTNCSPAEILMLNKRRLRTTLDLLHPCQTDNAKGRVHQKVNYDLHIRPRQYIIGDAVWIRNFQSEPCRSS